MATGHLGEWIASTVFPIQLESSAVSAAIDGRFTTGLLKDKTVNVKWYLKREGLLDLTGSDRLDFYLALAGPVSPAVSSRRATRPWCIASVHLFDARQILAEQRARGATTGTAASVRAAQWDAAEIYPRGINQTLPGDEEQQRMLQLFAPAKLS